MPARVCPFFCRGSCVGVVVASQMCATLTAHCEASRLRRDGNSAGSTLFHARALHRAGALFPCEAVNRITREATQSKPARRCALIADAARPAPFMRSVKAFPSDGNCVPSYWRPVICFVRDRSTAACCEFFAAFFSPFVAFFSPFSRPGRALHQTRSKPTPADGSRFFFRERPWHSPLSRSSLCDEQTIDEAHCFHFANEPFSSTLPCAGDDNFAPARPARSSRRKQWPSLAGPGKWAPRVDDERRARSPARRLSVSTRARPAVDCAVFETGTECVERAESMRLTQPSSSIMRQPARIDARAAMVDRRDLDLVVCRASSVTSFNLLLERVEGDPIAGIDHEARRDDRRKRSDAERRASITDLVRECVVSWPRRLLCARHFWRGRVNARAINEAGAFSRIPPRNADLSTRRSASDEEKLGRFVGGRN